jgi:hypothetical protein
MLLHCGRRGKPELKPAPVAGVGRKMPARQVGAAENYRSWDWGETFDLS